MRGAPLRLGLTIAFALAVGDFAFRTWFAAASPEHFVSEVVRPLSAAGESSGSNHVYLRRTWIANEPPTAAWVRVMGHDALEVFVNGRKLNSSPKVGMGRVAAAVLDITPYVHAGENSIAVHAAQLTIDRPPRIAVDGLCRFADGETLSLADPAEWRAANVYDRRGSFWYQTEFEDDHWAPAAVGAAERWSTQVDEPPRSITRSRDALWITAANPGGDAAFARTLRLDSAPRRAWVRLSATGAARLAINGVVVLRDDDSLAIDAGSFALERTVDVAPFLRAGENTLSIMVTDGGEAARLRADIEATSRTGDRVYAATGPNWLSADGREVDWSRPDLSDERWAPCRAEIGFQGVAPRQTLREWVSPTPPLWFSTRRSAWHAGIVLLTGCLGWIGCRLAQGLADSTAAPAGMRRMPAGLPAVALAGSAVVAAAGGLSTWDRAVTAEHVYTPMGLLLLVAIVPLQWLAMLALYGGQDANRAPASIAGPWRARRVAFAAAWVVVFVAALLLRLRDLTAEPIHHDEVTAYMFTMSIFEHGFPGGQVHPEIPFGFCATSELSFYPNALCALFVDDPQLVIRIPAVAFSMGTLLLLGYVGTRWFNAQTGFVAALLYAVAPHAIGLADFGRYLAQVQFFTLLSMYFAYEAAKGSGPLNVRALWCATASFIAMYLSWEGAGIFGLGLALATLVQRRDDLRSVITCRALYLATLAVVFVAVAQRAHRVNQQTQRLWYGEGISSLHLTPMWRYPFFDPDFYLMNSSWTKDAVLPMLGVAVACVLAVSHRWRHPLRFSLISLMVNACMMSTLLPLRSNRYAYHLSEIVLLVTAAAGVAGVEAIVRSAAGARSPGLRRYARGVATACLAVGVVLASGWFPRTAELRSFVTAAQGPRQLRIPDWVGPTEYLQDRLQEGDVIVSLLPHAQDFYFHRLGGEKAEPVRVGYWLESRLVVQATLGDERDVPLDRRSGAVMLYDLDQVEQLFADHDRVWYCTMRYAQSRINENDVSRYLRQHMDVVYEGFATAVLLRDKNHRPAPDRFEEDEAGKFAGDHFLK